MLKQIIIFIIFTCFFLCVAPNAFAQDNPAQTVTPVSTAPISEGNQPRDPQQVSTKFNYLSSHEFIITLLITLLALVALAMEFFLLKKTSKLKAEDTLRVFAVTLIIAGTLFFITAGFDANQVAPAMGLFGTIAGYLLGRSTQRKDDDDD